MGLPQSLLNQVDGERPTSPVFTAAQQFVLGDVQTYFKSFFKVELCLALVYKELKDNVIG